MGDREGLGMGSVPGFSWARPSIRIVGKGEEDVDGRGDPLGSTALQEGFGNHHSQDSSSSSGFFLASLRKVPSVSELLVPRSNLCTCFKA